jgi:hypothetical protein
MIYLISQLSHLSKHQFFEPNPNRKIATALGKENCEVSIRVEMLRFRRSPRIPECMQELCRAFCRPGQIFFSVYKCSEVEMFCRSFFFPQVHKSRFDRKMGSFFRSGLVSLNHQNGGHARPLLVQHLFSST